MVTPYFAVYPRHVLALVFLGGFSLEENRLVPPNGRDGFAIKTLVFPWARVSFSGRYRQNLPIEMKPDRRSELCPNF